jgi:hypothetical protein
MITSWADKEDKADTKYDVIQEQAKHGWQQQQQQPGSRWLQQQLLES